MSYSDSNEEIYSITSSQTIYRRSRSGSSGIPSRSSRTESKGLPKILVLPESGSKTYCPVKKWAVDYNNRNYVRSKCNKTRGLHRRIHGRPLDWHVEYDNSYFTRSKVNAPKGLHRRVPDAKRQYEPDDDDLADATGWEFEYGPEYDQIEQDVTYIPDGMIVTRGCYRWYGTQRNDSDCDHSDEEHRDNLLNEELEEELKYGPEFLQSDRPHMTEQLERKYSRGGYRHYEVQRNAYDIKPEEMAEAKTDPEWRRKHHSNGYRYMDLDMCEYDRDEEDRAAQSRKGKPFKRTTLNKVYELKKRDDTPEGAGRYGTRVSLVPGEGSKTLYEGKPDRQSYGKRASSIVDIFRKKSERSRIRRGSDFEEYERENVEKRHEELNPEYADKMRQMTSATRQPKRSQSFEDQLSEESERVEHIAYDMKSVGEKRRDKEEKRYDLRKERYSDSHSERPSQESKISRSTRDTGHRFAPPDEGSKGRPDKYSHGKKASSTFKVYKKKSEMSRIQRGSDYEEYEREDVEKRCEELGPDHADRTDEKRRDKEEERHGLRKERYRDSHSELPFQGSKISRSTRDTGNRYAQKAPDEKRRDKEEKRRDKEEKIYDLRKERYTDSRSEPPFQGSTSKSIRETGSRFAETAPEDLVPGKFTKSSKNRSSSLDDDDDGREAFETWRENVEIRREEYKEERRSKEKNKREDRDYQPQKVDKRRDGAKTYGYSDQEPQGSRGSNRRLKDESTQYESRTQVDKRRDGAKAYGYSDQEPQESKVSNRRLKDENIQYESRTQAPKRSNKEERRYELRKERYSEERTDRPDRGSKDSRYTQRRHTEMPTVKRSDEEEKSYDTRRERYSDSRTTEHPHRGSSGGRNNTRARFAGMAPTEKRSDRRQDTRFESRDKSYDRTEPRKRSGRSMRNNEDEMKDIQPGEDEIFERVPPEVARRMKKIQEKLDKNLGQLDESMNMEKAGRSMKSSHSFDIDLMKHKSHPKDRGHTHDAEYEKYTTKNGSSIWMKKEEKFSELHHRD